MYIKTWLLKDVNHVLMTILLVSSIIVTNWFFILMSICYFGYHGYIFVKEYDYWMGECRK